MSHKMLQHRHWLEVTVYQSVLYSQQNAFLWVLADAIVWQLFVLVCYKPDSGSRLLSLAPAQHCKARGQLPSVHHCCSLWARGLDCVLHFSWARAIRYRKTVLILKCTSALLED